MPLIKHSAAVKVLTSVTFPLPAAVTNYRFVRPAGGEFKNSASATATLSDLNNGENIRAELTLANGCTAVVSMTMIENTITAGTIAPALQTVCSGDAPKFTYQYCKSYIYRRGHRYLRVAEL